MKVVHSLEGQKVERVVDKTTFLVSNKNGGFIWMGNNPESRYQGIFFSIGGKMFRVIEGFSKNDFTEVNNEFFSVTRSRGEEKEKIFMPDSLNSVVYEPGYDFEFYLDFKEAYGSDYAGYNLERYENGIVIKFSYRGEEYFLAVRFDGEFVWNERRFDRFYEYDKARNSYPYERNVYCPGYLKSRKVVFSFSKKREDSIKEAEEVYGNTKKYMDEKAARIKKSLNNIASEKVNIAYNAARVNLDNLADRRGIFAGYPWFFQYWARDELISLKAFSEIDKELAREFLKKWTSIIGEKFAISSKEKIDGSYEGNSVDAIGWLFKRLELYPELMQEYRDKLFNFFNHLDDSFIETRGDSWMDSIERINGVELQAMKLYILKFAQRIDNKSSFTELAKKFEQKLKDKYYRDGKLLDADDGKTRPNVFMVYYFCPELFSKPEWEGIFDSALKELWLDWGGLSTVSKNDPVFKNDYTGEIGGSYHNGDSWFWINNLAGIALADLNKEKYYDKIKKILSASTDEILFSGAIGNHAELSSASRLRSEGAVSQAFSAAMFVEFVDKLTDL